MWMTSGQYKTSSYYTSRDLFTFGVFFLFLFVNNKHHATVFLNGGWFKIICCCYLVIAKKFHLFLNRFQKFFFADNFQTMLIYFPKSKVWWFGYWLLPFNKKYIPKKLQKSVKQQLIKSVQMLLVSVALSRFMCLFFISIVLTLWILYADLLRFW